MEEEKRKEKIIIVGAGPGGLTAAMILANRGFDVEVFEKQKTLGGRNAPIKKKGYTFDIGPTFLMMKFILDEVFEEAGKHIDDYLEIKQINPMYRLLFKNQTIDMESDKQKMKEQIKKLFPGQEEGYEKFLIKETKRFKKMLPCLQKPYNTPWSMLHSDLLKAIPHLSLTKTMHQELANYFNAEDLKAAFTFQSKYLGMSPWDCPAAFMIIPYLEHAFGVWHPIGGLSKISEAMAKAAEENGARINLGTPVKKLLIQNKKVLGVELENGEQKMADTCVINADFGHAMTKLVEPGILKKYSAKKMEKKKLSCSTFMLYLGVKAKYKNPHHTIIFSENYEEFVKKISVGKSVPEDISIYVRNASVTDKTLAPKGKSNIYVLVPVPNNKSGIDWDKEKNNFRNKIIKKIEERLGMKNLSKNIETETIITPKDWEEKMDVYQGATFNLAHTLGQMLYFRPRNKFEELENCYLAGGGTHPGSGLPTIYESGRITANMISKKFKKIFISKNLHA